MYKKVVLTLVLVLLFSLTAQGKFMLILNFDDGYRGVYTNALPIMERYNIQGVVFAITYFLDNERHMSLEQLKTLREKGWEIGSHTVHHYDLQQLSEDEINYQVSYSKKFLLEHNLIKDTYSSFSSPMGRWDNKIQSAVFKNYSLARSNQLYDCKTGEEIPVILRVALKETSISTVKRWLDRATKNDKPLILVFHEIAPGGNEYFFPLEKFEKVIELIKDYPVITFEEGFHSSVISEY